MEQLNNFEFYLHNVEMRPGNGAVLARSAGTSVQIMSHDQDYTTLKLASGEVRRVQSLCKATIGAVSNPDQKNIKIGKAGRSGRNSSRQPQLSNS